MLLVFKLMLVRVLKKNLFKRKKDKIKKKKLIFKYYDIHFKIIFNFVLIVNILLLASLFHGKLVLFVNACDFAYEHRAYFDYLIHNSKFHTRSYLVFAIFA